MVASCGRARRRSAKRQGEAGPAGARQGGQTECRAVWLAGRRTDRRAVWLAGWIWSGGHELVDSGLACPACVGSGQAE